MPLRPCFFGVAVIGALGLLYGCDPAYAVRVDNRSPVDVVIGAQGTGKEVPVPGQTAKLIIETMGSPTWDGSGRLLVYRSDNCALVADKWLNDLGNFSDLLVEITEGGRVEFHTGTSIKATAALDEWEPGHCPTWPN